MSETPCEWLDGLLNGDYDFTVYSRKNARAELAQLRADLQAAREIISIAKNDYQEDVQNGIDSYDKGQRCIDWLAANPAPEPQP